MENGKISSNLLDSIKQLEMLEYLADAFQESINIPSTVPWNGFRVTLSNVTDKIRESVSYLDNSQSISKIQGAIVTGNSGSSSMNTSSILGRIQPAPTVTGRVREIKTESETQ